MTFYFYLYLVVVIDINPVKIVFEKRNADIYGVAHKIEFIVEDLFTNAEIRCRMYVVILGRTRLFN